MRVRTAGELRESAAAVGSRVELHDVVLSSADFKAQPRSDATRILCRVELQITSRVENDRVECWSRYQMVAHEMQGDEEVGLAWALDLEALARYNLDEGQALSNDQLEAFAVVEGAPVIHPYATAWTQIYTSQSAFPAFTLGAIATLGDGNPETPIEFPDEDDDYTYPSR